MTNMLEARHLEARYGRIHAVRGISFDARPGEVLAIIGPNGSGKTTTMECLEGLQRPSGGSVELFGKDPFLARRDVMRDVGVQLQQTDYPVRIRVGELCQMFSALYKDPADWQQLLQQLELSGKEKQLVRSLSGGERQKLSILLALMGRPKILFLDEVTTGLAPEARRQILRLVHALRDAGTTIVLVSHYLDEVEALADRLLFLEGGTCRFFGSLPAFREFAQMYAQNDAKKQNPTLEELYLALVPDQAAPEVKGAIRS